MVPFDGYLDALSKGVLGVNVASLLCWAARCMPETILEQHQSADSAW